MTSTISAPRLSICITTLNRAAFIGATLESIVPQLTNDCEIVVLDAASTDNTESVVSKYVHSCDRLRYIRQETNNGIDRDFDRTVQLARGDYCWLMSDDDVLKPGAIAAVLQVLSQEYSLILVNGEHRDISMSTVLVPNFFTIESDRVYAPGDLDGLFRELGKCLICICCVVIRRTIWLERERESYYGSMFVHVGVIFQHSLPGRTLVMAEPLMSLRWGNQQSWFPEQVEIFFFKWPSLVWSLALSDSTKKAHCSPEPWKRLRYLLPLRASGWYCLTNYRRWIRPRLHSFPDLLIPALVLLLPSAMARGFYSLHSRLLGVPHSLEEAFRRNSTAPESLDSLNWPYLPRRSREQRAS